MRTCFIVCCLFHAVSLAQSAEIDVTGSEGGEVFFICAHRFAHNYNKYFCKGLCKNGEGILATVESGRQTVSGRITLVDLGNGTFTVNIRDLQLSDSGTYWCAVDRLGLDTYTSVSLSVNKAAATTTVAPVFSSTWTQNTTNSTQLRNDVETKTPTNLVTVTEAPTANFLKTSPSPILYAAVGTVGTLIILILTTAFKKCRKVSKPQPLVVGNNSRKELDCEKNGIQWDKMMFSRHQEQDPQTSAHTGSGRSAPCPVYENISFVSGNEGSRDPPKDQQNQEVPSRIYITLLPSEASARTAVGSALKHTIKPLRSESTATSAASAPECVSTEETPTSLWFGL